MKQVIIAGLIITVILLTNIATLGLTILVNDHLWQQHISELETIHQNEIKQTEYKIFSSVHRSCMIVVEDNNVCNLSGRKIYLLYQKNWKPLPGFDFDLITIEEKKNTY